jgi:hypothetical protein
LFHIFVEAHSIFTNNCGIFFMLFPKEINFGGKREKKGEKKKKKREREKEEEIFILFKDYTMHSSSCDKLDIRVWE